VQPCRRAVFAGTGSILLAESIGQVGQADTGKDVEKDFESGFWRCFSWLKPVLLSLPVTECVNHGSSTLPVEKSFRIGG
jgi:hypothetical protein